MRIETTVRDGAHVVELDGKLDTNASTEFEVHLESLLKAGATRIVIDLGKLAFVTSSGLRVMLQTAKQLKANDGELCVCSLNDVVQEVFDMTGFNILLRVFASADEAVRDL